MSFLCLYKCNQVDPLMVQNVGLSGRINFCNVNFSDEDVIIINPGVSDKLVCSNTDNMIQSYEENTDNVKSK